MQKNNKTQTETEKLPPTINVLTISYGLGDVHHQNLGGRKKAIISELKLAPDAIIELFKCGSSCGRCQSLTCSCKRASSKHQDVLYEGHKGNLYKNTEVTFNGHSDEDTEWMRMDKL